LHPLRTKRFNTQKDNERFGGFYLLLQGIFENIPACEFTRIDPKKKSFEFKNFAQSFDDIVVFRRVRDKDMFLSHRIASCEKFINVPLG